MLGSLHPVSHSSSEQPCEVGTINCVLQMREVRFREDKKLPKVMQLVSDKLCLASESDCL